MTYSDENVDADVVDGFGDEWTRFAQDELDEAELKGIFEQYFAVMPDEALSPDAVGADFGCGTGRWARFVAERVGTLHCVEPSKAIEVARKNLASFQNVEFHETTIGAMDIAPESLDFGYSLGVLHHIPDTELALRQCVETLKMGAPFLVYLYYAFDNRPLWFRGLWKVSDTVRARVSDLPQKRKELVCDALAATVYLPLARGAKVAEKLGADVGSFPLSAYRDRSFYTMRTDSLDRFGTRLEQRFTRDEIRGLMSRAGLDRIRFHDGEPYWCAVGFRSE
jgi:SAM-dependent methyltransferase